MLIKSIISFGTRKVLACDGNCAKAWGISRRPKEQLGDDADDVVYLADSELTLAPRDPGTYEGGFGKPTDMAERLNKWCLRECERSATADSKQAVVLPDHSRRRYNFAARQLLAELEAQTS